MLRAIISGFLFMLSIAVSVGNVGVIMMFARATSDLHKRFYAKLSGLIMAVSLLIAFSAGLIIR